MVPQIERPISEVEKPPSAGGRPGSDCIFDEDTGVETPAVEGNAHADAVVCDLQGRRVAQPTKGLYIVSSAEGRLQGKNGKKVFINK